ncbi:MAG: WG repeat-containing protein [Bacteroidia bacterium]|nr:WG repeat-containing protein [Bacteroidia bacterium]
MKTPRKISAFSFLPVWIPLVSMVFYGCESEQEVPQEQAVEIPVEDWSHELGKNLKELKSIEIRKAVKDDQSGTFSIEMGEGKGMKFILWGSQQLDEKERMMVEANLHMLLDPQANSSGEAGGEGLGMDLGLPAGMQPPIPLRQESTPELSCILHMTAGLASVMKGDTLNASRQFDQALAACPLEEGGSNLFLAHYFKGKFALQQGKVEAASQAFQMALLNAPPDTTIKSNLERLIERLALGEYLAERDLKGKNGKTQILNAANLNDSRIKFPEPTEHVPVTGELYDQDAPADADSVYYQRVDRFGKHFRVLRGGDWGIVDYSGKELVPCEYLWIEQLSEGLAWIRKDSLFGFIDLDGNWLVPLKYAFAGDFSEGIALIKRGNLYGYINRKGEEIISPRFEDAEGFREGLALVKQGGKFGYIDKQGKYLFTPQFQEANLFKSGLAAVEKEGKAGIIARDGSWQIKPIYQSAVAMGENWILLSSEEGERLFDVKNKSLSETAYDQVEEVERIGFLVRKGGKSGLLHSDGKIWIEPQFAELIQAGDQVMKARSGQKWKLINLQTNSYRVSDQSFDEIGEEFENLIRIRSGSKFGFTDTHGQLIIPAKFDSAGNYFSNMCSVWENGRNTFIDKQGKCILHCE